MKANILFELHRGESREKEGQSQHSLEFKEEVSARYAVIIGNIGGSARDRLGGSHMGTRCSSYAV